MRQVVHFYKWCIIHQVDFGAPPVKLVADFLIYLFQDRSCSPAPLMVTGQPLLIDWEISPSISVRMKISLVSWIVSTETDPKAGRESPPGTSPWFLHQLTRFILIQLKRPPWSIWPSRHFSTWPWGRASVEVGYMLGKTEILDTNPTGQRCPCTHHLAFFPRISWPKRVQTVWPQGL